MPDQYFQPSTVGGRVPAMGPTGRLPRGLSQVCDNSRAENLATAGCMTGVCFHEQRAASPARMRPYEPGLRIPQAPNHPTLRRTTS
jgi:hypothetical protein